MSRSETMPTMRRSTPRMSTAPMRRSASSATTEESVVLGSTLTTSRPLAARMMLTVIVASLTFTARDSASGEAATAKAISSMFGSAPSSGGVSATAAMQHRVPRSIARRPAPTLDAMVAGQCGNGVTRRWFNHSLRCRARRAAPRDRTHRTGKVRRKSRRHGPAKRSPGPPRYRTRSCRSRTARSARARRRGIRENADREASRRAKRPVGDRPHRSARANAPTGPSG